MGKLEGKTALITGVDSSVGLATAKLFVTEGAYVFITGRREPELTAAVKEIGSNVTGLRVDVSNLAELDRLFAHIEREEGRLDIVFPTAGAAELAPSDKTAVDDNYSTFTINVKGQFFTVQRALPLLAEGASIILNASTVSTDEAVNGLDSAIRAVVRSFARAWTMNLKDRRIRVNAVNSRTIQRPESNDLIDSTRTDEQSLRAHSSDGSLGRPSTLAEIAKAVVSLCDESSDVTGTELSMDGGRAYFKVLSHGVPGGRLGTPDVIAKSALYLASDDSSNITGIELFVDGDMAEL